MYVLAEQWPLVLPLTVYPCVLAKPPDEGVKEETMEVVGDSQARNEGGFEEEKGAEGDGSAATWEPNQRTL